MEPAGLWGLFLHGHQKYQSSWLAFLSFFYFSSRHDDLGHQGVRVLLGLACSPCCLWFRIQPSPAQLSPAGIALGSLVSRSVSLALLSPRPTQLPDILTQCFQSPLALKCVTYPAVNYLLTAHHPIGARQPSVVSVTTGEAFSGQEEG